MRIDFDPVTFGSFVDCLICLAKSRETVTINGQRYVLRGSGDGLFGMAIAVDGTPISYRGMEAGVERRILFEEINTVEVH